MKEQNEQRLIEQLRKANIDLMNELKVMEKNMSVWRFLAWVTLAIFVAFVFVVVIK